MKINAVARFALQSAQVEPSQAAIMNPRFATVAAVLTVVLAGWVVVWLADFGSASIDNSDAATIADRRPASPAVDAKLADAPQATAMRNPAVDGANMAAPAEAVTATKTRVAPDEPKPIVETALTEPSQVRSLENAAGTGFDSEHVRSGT